MPAIRPVLVVCLVFAALLSSSVTQVCAADTLPDDMVNAGLAKLSEAARVHGKHKENREQDLEDGVRLFLAEYTDVRYAARLILANHWEDATSGQRGRFEKAFNNQVTNLLVKLLPDVDFESVRVEPFPGDVQEPPLIIQATFQTSDKQTIHFGLVIHESNGRWLIFDVIAEGVSYIKTYRNQLTGEAADTGLEAMIERFEVRSTRQGSG